MKIQITRKNYILTPLINKKLEERNNQVYHSIDKRLKIRPSDISECLRFIYYEVLRVLSVEKIDAQTQRTFDVGKDMHIRYQKNYLKDLKDNNGNPVYKKYEKNGKLVDAKERLYYDKDLWLCGKPDAEVNINGVDYILELKSCKQEIFQYLSKPQSYHVEQGHCYMYLAKIPRVLFYYENRSDQDVKEFVVEFDSKVWARVIEKIEKVQMAVKEKVVPNREAKENWCIKNCKHHETCYRGGIK